MLASVYQLAGRLALTLGGVQNGKLRKGEIKLDDSGSITMPHKLRWANLLHASVLDTRDRNR